MTAKQILDLTPEQIAKLPSKEIPLLAEAYIQLDRDIKSAEQLLGFYRQRFIKEGEAEAAAAEVALKGTTWNFMTPAGESVEVQFPEDALIKGGFIIMPDGEIFRSKDRKLILMPNLVALAGKAFNKLFAETWMLKKSFREIAPALLGESKGAQIIAACEEPSSPRVTPKTAKGSAVYQKPHHD